MDEVIILKGEVSNKCDFMAHRCKRCGKWIIAPPDRIAQLYEEHLKNEHKLLNVKVVTQYADIHII